MTPVMVDDQPLLPLPEEGMLRVNDVIQFVRVSRSTWLAWVQQGIAPKPFKVGCNTFWSARAIRAFIRAQEQCDVAA